MGSPDVAWRKSFGFENGFLAVMIFVPNFLAEFKAFQNKHPPKEFKTSKRYLRPTAFSKVFKFNPTDSCLSVCCRCIQPPSVGTGSSKGDFG